MITGRPWVVYATAASGVVAYRPLVYRELHFSDPIVDLRILKERSFTVALVVIVGMSFVLFGTILLSPVFLQELMGYDAWKAGLVQAPRGLGSMFSMMMVGQLARGRVDTPQVYRPRLHPGVDRLVDDVRVELAGKYVGGGVAESRDGIGAGHDFPDRIGGRTLVRDPRERMGYASGLFNMMRNTGAALGIAYMTNFLISQQQIHQSTLVEHFSVFDAWRLSNLARPQAGAPSFRTLPQILTGQKQGLGMVYGAIQAQSAMLSLMTSTEFWPSRWFC